MLDILFCTDNTPNVVSLTKLVSAISHYLISISPAALVCILVFPIRVSVIHLCTQAELVKRCSIDASHINAMLTPFNTALSSLCCTSFSFCNQLASSLSAPLCSNETLVASELVLAQTLSPGPLTHHLYRVFLVHSCNHFFHHCLYPEKKLTSWIKAHKTMPCVSVVQLLSSPD